MRIQILGDFRLCSGDPLTGRPVRMAHKVENLATALVVRANQVVSSDQLIAELWGDCPPRRATATLHVYVSQLRKHIATAEPPVATLITRPNGYLLELDPDEVDLTHFRRRIESGRRLVRERRIEEAGEAFRSALDLWRGPALAGLRNGQIVDGCVTWLDELHLECTEQLVDAELALGRERELVGVLQALVVEHPYNEVHYRQLMLALYRSGRRADALDVYRRARTTLTSELGLEPCRPLQELHRSILGAGRHTLDVAV